MNRRDFLKLAGTFPLALALPPAVRRAIGASSNAQQNVIIVVFDAWSAHDISLYGYGRRTTPNIDRLAQRAIIYRNHISGGNFTTPGTASILTGTYPWTHKATRPWQGVSPAFNDQSLFSAFDDYYRFAYTHNDLAWIILKDFSKRIQQLPDVEDLFLKSPPAWLRHVFQGDRDAASLAWSRTMAVHSGRTGYSLFASQVLEMQGENAQLQALRRDFPRGLPTRNDYTTAFILETAVDWLIHEAAAAAQPFLTYVHLLPPHSPYNTRVDFVDAFQSDGFQVPPKPFDPVAENYPKLFREDSRVYDQYISYVNENRRLYDEYILYVDAEFANLYKRLEAAGQLENTWLILTSDHGQIFERGFLGHHTPSLYQPEIHVPLLIFEPGRKTSLEVHEPTSAVDLLPTLCYLTGHGIPAWTEGVVLPPFLTPEARRAGGIYSFIERPDLGPFNWTAANIRWPYKAMYFNGYAGLDRLRTVNRNNMKVVETLGGKNKLLRLFDLQTDPDELHDLAVELPEIVQELVPPLEAALRDFMGGK